MTSRGSAVHVRSERVKPDWESGESLRELARRSPLMETLAVRERYRDEYWLTRDPIVADRLYWRAQTFRHTVHLLPGQTILEIGCGAGLFTERLLKITRGENPITSITFQDTPTFDRVKHPSVELIQLSEMPGFLAGRTFDCVIAMDLLDAKDAPDFLQIVHELLAPGGEVVFYESNPWNPVHQIRRVIARMAGRTDPRRLLGRERLYEQLSEIGFIRVYAVYNDFVFAPLTRGLIWWLRNLSILLENAPFVSRMAGSILLHAQRPPRNKREIAVSFCPPPMLRRAVSIVIPCRNEEANVAVLIPRLLALYGEYIHELIPVDDGSTDATREVIASLAAQEPRVKPLYRVPPNGVGRALADGLNAATGRYVLMMDCDFEQLLPELRDIFEAAPNGYDVVIGSRFSRHSVLLNYPFAKIFANRAFHLLARVFLGHTFRDTTNNLKLMKREVVSRLCLRQPGFAANAETGLQPWLLGCKVREMPISWIDRTPGMGTSSFRLARVGGGYWSVLYGLWLKKTFGVGPYRELGCRGASPDRVATEGA